MRGSPAVTASSAKAELVNERVKKKTGLFLSLASMSLLASSPPATTTHCYTLSPMHTLAVSQGALSFLSLLFHFHHTSHIFHSILSRFISLCPLFLPPPTRSLSLSLSRFPSSVRIIEASPPCLSSLSAAFGQSAAREARLRGGRMDRERERESGRGEGGEGERR